MEKNLFEIRMIQNVYDTTLQMWYNGELIDEWSDGGEPEDQIFCRDWDWVSGALETAYKLGQNSAWRKVAKALGHTVK